MKKFFAVLICLVLLTAILPLTLSAAAVPIDAANFPDPVFLEYVRQFVLDGNGTLSETECLAVTSVSISEILNDAVSSLEGIKNFTKLERVNCCCSNLSDLDLSGLSDLKSVYCYQNNLKTLNLSGCSSLTMLNCEFNHLESIDLTGCVKLDTIMCAHNKLTELNITACTKLQSLSIYKNNITAINVSANAELVYFTSTPQEVTAQKVQKSGKWTVDLGALVGESNLEKVTVDDGVLDITTGILTFDSEPVQFGYTYHSSDKFGMDATVTLYEGSLPVLTANNLSFDPRDTAFDPLTESGLNLKAVDAEDGNLTANIKAQVKTVAVWGSAASNATIAYNMIQAVDVKTPGLYILTYTVTDSDGNTASLDVFIAVRNDGSTSSAYSGSETSTYSPATNTATGPSVSSNQTSAENSAGTSEELSAESGVLTPSMGAQDSGVTMALVAVLILGAVVCLIVRHRAKAG